MTSEEEERPRFVTGGYRRHWRQWVKDMNVIEIHTKWCGNFRRFEWLRVNLSHGSQNWFRVIVSLKKSRVQETRGRIVELEWSKSKRNKVWIEILGGSGNRGFEKSGFHCILYYIYDVITFLNYILLHGHSSILSNLSQPLNVNAQITFPKLQVRANFVFQDPNGLK